MTQKESDKFLADTKVYVNGKSKEIQEMLFSFGFSWLINVQVSHTEEPFLYLDEDKKITWGNDMKKFTTNKYREITAEQILSLELTEPSCRPFKNAEECWNEMLKHEPFGWLKSKISGNFAHLGCICQFGERVNVAWSTNEKEWFDAYFVYGNYTFADGTPFGFKEE